MKDIIDHPQNVEPKSMRGRCYALVESGRFQMLTTGLIFINAVFIGVETEVNWQGRSQHSELWMGMEIVFTGLFTVELVLRIFAHRWAFWLQWWNIFDAILVGLAFSDTVVIGIFLAKFTAEDSQNLEDSSEIDVLIVFRVVRLLRLARLIRLLRFFKELWLLASGVLSSVRTLTWTLVLMVLTIYVFAIILTRIIGHEYGCEYARTVVSAGCSADEDRKSMDTWWGTVPRSMFTLFQLITTEGLADITRTSMKFSSMASIFFIVFMFMTSVALMNVMIAVIVENTLESAMTLREDVSKTIEINMQRAMEKIVEVFEIADANRDGGLSKSEFLQALRNNAVMKLLHESEIDLHNAEELFDILDFDESGQLDVTEFLEGCMRARGEARAKDILALQCDLVRTQQYVEVELDKASQFLEERFARLAENAAWLGSVAVAYKAGSRPPSGSSSPRPVHTTSAPAILPSPAGAKKMDFPDE